MKVGFREEQNCLVNLIMFSLSSIQERAHKYNFPIQIITIIIIIKLSYSHEIIFNDMLGVIVVNNI